MIDEVRVYDRALSSAESAGRDVDAHPEEQDRARGGPGGAYAFDAGSGTVAADASGKGKTGTIYGATWTPRGRSVLRCGSTAPVRWFACQGRRR